jgi:ParB family transcriptional regulator, chromosome partitioning protein
MAKPTKIEVTETPPTTVEYVPRQLYPIKISDLSPDPDQPRKLFDPVGLGELENSIRTHGILQPILFRSNDDGHLIIVSGERRFQASKNAGLEEIPAIYTEGKPAEIALVENMMRVGLTPLEEAEGLQRLQDEAGYNNQQLAAAIGKAPSTISEILLLNKLSDKIKVKIRGTNQFSRRQLVEIAKIKDEKKMGKAFKLLEKHNTSSDDLRDSKRGVRKNESVIKTMVQSLISKLNGLDFSSLEEKEHESIKEQLNELTEVISKIAS